MPRRARLHSLVWLRGDRRRRCGQPRGARCGGLGRGSRRSHQRASPRDDDTLLGGGGNDTIDGGDGDDTLVGGAGIDRLDGDGDTLYPGNDRIEARDGNAKSINCGIGADTADPGSRCEVVDRAAAAPAP